MFRPKALWQYLPAILLLPLSALGAPPASLRVELSKDVSLELIEIAPGAFQQGSPASEPGRHPDETPRQVRLTKKFYLGKYPVTRGEFAAFADTTGYKTEAETGRSGGYGWGGQGLVQNREFTWRSPGFSQTDRDPVVLVTYSDTQAFLAWLSNKGSRQFQLPTEAQWEYACRAGTTTAWQNGNDPAAADAIAWNKANAGQGTKPVGQRPFNAWGLGDMAGNVWEWCEDWYAPYAAGAQTDPQQTDANLSEKPRRVLRGGSWLRDRLDCRSAARYRNDARSRNADNGFRVMAFDETTAPKTTAVLPAAPAAKLAPQEVSSATGAATPLGRKIPIARADGGIVFFVLVAVVFFGFRLFRRIFGFFSGGSPAGWTPGLAQPRIANDGFWIAEGAFPRGTTLLCHYVTVANEQTTQIVFEPGPQGQFVYTGQMPTQIRIETIAGVQTPGVIYDDNDFPLVGNIPPPMPPPDLDPGSPPNYPPASGPPPAY